MSDPPGCPVRLRLPDGRIVDARLLERRQDAAGAWTYTVALQVPAAAVVPVEGESYELVPTWRPWMLHTRWLSRPGELHRSACASVPGPAGLGLRGLTTAQARAHLAAEPDTILCPWCQPAP